MNDYAFGNFLYALRKEKQLSQTQLAQLLGVTNKAVSKWENGASKPNTVLLPKLAELLDVSVEELFACRRFEKNTQLEQIKGYLASQKKRYTVLSSVFLAATVIFPLLMMEFICVMMGFRLPDAVAGPVGAMVLIFAFVVSLAAFLICRSNERHCWTPNDLLPEPAFTKKIKFGVLLCSLSLPGLLFITALVCGILLPIIKEPIPVYLFLAAATLVMILLLGVLVCLLRIKRLLKIRFHERTGEKRKPIPFREQPVWVKICLFAGMVLFSVTVCLWFTPYTQLKYVTMLLLLTVNIVLGICGIRHRR